ncbi:unnamed protein product [Ectocarpus sp. CCAP 1310/34]|nr:unnamed protein product [Ectocarpus sp. CCAP 1310/34]
MIELLSCYPVLLSSAPLVAFGTGEGRWSEWTRRHATEALRQVVSLAGLPSSEYALHSLRIGGATYLAAGEASPGDSSWVDQGPAATDPKASGEAIDEMLAANDPDSKKRKNPEPGFPTERSGAVGKKGSYPVGSKLKAVAFTRVVCEDGKPVRNSGAAKVLVVLRRRIVEWVRDEESLRANVSANPKLSKAKQIHAGGKASTADIEEALVEFINDQRKHHVGCAKPKPEGALAFKSKFKSWYQRFRKRNKLSIRRRISVDQKLPKGHEGMAWTTLMKLRKALLERAGEIYAQRYPPAPGESPIRGEDLSSSQLELVTDELFEELGNMDQTPVQHEMPVETTLEKTGVKDARIATGGPAAHFKGTPFVSPATPGKGKATQPRKNSIAWEVLPANRSKHGLPVGGMSFGVQEKSWCDLRECKLWIKDSWELRPNNGSICHKDDGFIAALKREASTIVIFIPGGLTPLLQPLDRMLNKQRLLRGMYTAHTAKAVRDPKTGKLAPPGRGAVATWCKNAWASITPETVKTCFKICGLTLALDGSEDHAWCLHNFGDGYRELLEQQRVEWLAEHPNVTLPPLQLPKVPAESTANHIEAAAKELEEWLLPRGDDSDIEIEDDDSDVEVVEGAGDEEVIEL